MELSLGKINFLIKTLMSKGFLKIDNFNRSRNKLGYLYLMTPKGLEKKKKLTMLFLERKAKEFDKLKKEMKHINNL